jgi:N-acetylglucosamine-6-sulfatase
MPASLPISPQGVALTLVTALTLGLLAGCADNPLTDERAALDRPAEQFDPAAPNVVVVMTDDQALDTMRAMPRTGELLGERGTRFRQALVSFPLCCPSRASFLTGQYAHNHGVLDNGPPNGGLDRLAQESTLPVWLSDAGYRTGFVGKYLNGYGKGRNGGNRFVPPGWSEWYAATAGDKKDAYDYKLNENGEPVRYRRRAVHHKTDVFAEKARGFVARNAGERPFFLWVATSAPHADSGLPEDAPRNPVPARRHIGAFADAALPRPPSFNEADVSDKPLFVSREPLIGPERQRAMRRQYVSELESLLAVDELVEGLVEELRRSGELERTLIVFTSDNGYLRGQHRLDSGKSKLFDESVRVPLLVRGPGFEPGAQVAAPVANIDLVATIVAATGAEPDLELDGVTLEDTAAGGRRRGVLLEVFERQQDRFRAVRTDRWVFGRREDGRDELYDRARDPHELDNLAGERRYRGIRSRLGEELDRLRDCAGAECR